MGDASPGQPSGRIGSSSTRMPGACCRRRRVLEPSLARLPRHRPGPRTAAELVAWPPSASVPAAPPPPGEGLTVAGVQYPAGPPEHWPAAPPWPPAPGSAAGGPPPPSGPDRTGRIIAAVAVVALLLVVGVVALVGRSDDSDQAAADVGPPTSAPEIPPSSSDPVPPISADPTAPDTEGPEIPGLDPSVEARPLEEVLPELIDFVERTRGHRFRTPPVVEAVAEEEFEARLAELQADEAEALEAATVAQVGLGLIEPGTSLADIVGELGAAAVLGFYLPETDELLVKGAQVTPLVQVTIVHELTHALDDQLFDLDRLDGLVERDDESGFGLQLVAEGTARYVDTTYREQLDPDEEAAVEIEELQIGLDQMLDLSDVPLSFLIASRVPYGSGQRFVRAVLERGGVGQLDGAFQRPPTTSEQALDPEVFFARDPAREVTAPTADGPVVDEGTFGAVDLRLLELASDPTNLMGDAASGEIDPVPDFGGGRYVSWTDGGRSCVQITLVGDDDVGQAAIGVILDGWVTGIGSGASVVSSSGPSGEQLVATRCA